MTTSFPTSPISSRQPIGRRLAVALAVAALLIGLFVPAVARGDGDPASDTLLGENVFYPYSPPVAARLQQALNAEARSAARAHFPIKIALIGSRTDLGAVPILFNQPQKYADFLDQEISFSTRQPLLVVMPSGYGVRALPVAAMAAASSLKPPTGGQVNALAQAAIAAVPRLAAAAGRPIKALSVSSTTGGSGGSQTALIAAALAVAAVAIAGSVILIRLRRARLAPANAPQPRRPPPPPPPRRSRRGR